MLMASVGRYPGDDASPLDLNRLADFYRDAAHRAAASIQLGDPMSAAPMRMLAIHSIELNLSAFLLATGLSQVDIRKLGHDLATRVDLATGKGLDLRQRTIAHVRVVARDREYLIPRYGPDCLSGLPQTNRVLATLGEVAAKVSRALCKPHCTSERAPPGTSSERKIATSKSRDLPTLRQGFMSQTGRSQSSSHTRK